MNELLFFLHLFLVLLFSWGALRLGKEGLIVWITLQALVANLFVIKQIELFGMTVTCSDVYAIGSILGLNLLQEYFGKLWASRAIWICFFMMVFFALITEMHLFYVPSHVDTTHAAYEKILATTPRLLLASLFTFFCVQRIDLSIFGFLQGALPERSLAFRTAISLICSQFLDTVLFSLLGLYGMVASLASVIFLSFFVKLILIVTMMPALTFLKRRVHEV